MLRRVRSFFLWWLAGVLGVAILLFYALDIPKALRLRRDPKMTTGSIVAKDPSNHMTITVEYTVLGALFRLSSFGSVKDSIGAGKMVYYEPGNPANAALQEPHQLAKEEFEFGAVASALLPTVIATLLFFRKRGRNSMRSGGPVVVGIQITDGSLCHVERA